MGVLSDTEGKGFESIIHDLWVNHVGVGGCTI